MELNPYFIPNVVLKIFICCNIDTNAAILEPLCLHFVAWTRYCRNYNVGHGKAFLSRQIGGMHNMSRMIPLYVIRFR